MSEQNERAQEPTARLQRPRRRNEGLQGVSMIGKTASRLELKWASVASWAESLHT